MFSKLMLFSCFLFFLGAAGLYHFQIQEKRGDKKEYETLVEENQALQWKEAPEGTPIQQFRKDVQKDIWTAQGEERSHFSLKAAHSNLILGHLEKNIEATEYLYDLECMSQENKEGENQEIRVLTSAEGTYFYPSHRFVANSVNLLFFQIPGKDLPTAMPSTPPYLRGRANDATFSADSNTLQFTAQHLKANLDGEQVQP